jgi:hypothetical protein
MQGLNAEGGRKTITHEPQKEKKTRVDLNLEGENDSVGNHRTQTGDWIGDRGEGEKTLEKKNVRERI